MKSLTGIGLHVHKTNTEMMIIIHRHSVMTHMKISTRKNVESCVNRLSESVTDTDSQIIPTVRPTTAVHDVKYKCLFTNYVGG